MATLPGPAVCVRSSAMALPFPRSQSAVGPAPTGAEGGDGLVRDLPDRICGRRMVVAHSSGRRRSWWNPHTLTRQRRPNIHRPGEDFNLAAEEFHEPATECWPTDAP